MQDISPKRMETHKLRTTEVSSKTIVLVGFGKGGIVSDSKEG